MASIPLPALSVHAPQPQDPVEGIKNLYALKAMQNQQQLQAQALTAAGQENQQRALQIKDQQAMTTAMQSWDGRDVEQLPTLILKSGGSANAVMGMKQKILEQRKAFSDIAKNDSETGAKTLETMNGKNDLIAGKIGAVLAQPDEQLAPALLQTAQELSQTPGPDGKPLLDPQHIGVAQQIAQSGDPKAIRSQLTILQKSFMGAKAQGEQALKEAQTRSASSEAELRGAQADWAKKNGLPQGVSVDEQELADFLKKNPGKGAADFLVFKAKNSPQMLVMGNQLQNPQALDFAAENYRRTGQLPAGFTRSPQTMSSIIARAAELDKQAGGAGIAANKSDLDAQRKSLDSLQKNFDQVSAFEGTARKNLDLLLDKAAKVPELGARFANVPIRMINEKMLGTKEMAEFRAALTTAQTETAKVLNSSNASGVLSDTARKELEDIMSGNLPFGALKGQVETFKQDMDNRHLSYQMQLSDIKDRIKGGSSEQKPAASSNKDFFSQFGGTKR